MRTTRPTGRGAVAAAGPRSDRDGPVTRRPSTRIRVVLLAAVAVLCGLTGCDVTAAPPAPDVSVTRPAPSTSDTPRSGLPEVPVAELPAQARTVLARIAEGGPYRYPQDDRVFRNREGRLPDREAGYYREYTVPTPGESDRGARRLVVGEGGDVYYTADHYRTFRQVLL